MLSEFTASEVCRVCGKTRNRYVKTEGIYRNVIFDLMTEISGVVKIKIIFGMNLSLIN